MQKLLIGLAGILLVFYLAGCARSIPKENGESDYLRQIPPSSIPEIFAPGIVSVKRRFDMGFTMSADGNTLAFGVAHESDPTQTNIRFITRKNGDWSGPNMSLLPDNINTSLPMFGPRQGEFYFAKASHGNENDIWVANYTTEKITNTKSLPQIINSDKREAGHGKSTKGSFYFTSNRDDSQSCCGDIYRLASTDNPESIEKVIALSSESDEDGLYLSPSEDYMIIQAWKNEYQTKHDLYIAYRTAEGRWTRPKRLNDKINSPEIEQRPFISPDGNYLFFSRMSIEQDGKELLYESDIYWVSTQSVFTPYLYRTVNTFPVASDKKFTLQVPTDFFKDVNDRKLSYAVTLANGSPLPEHLEFDQKRMMIMGNLKEKSGITLSVKATDSHKNEASTYIEIISKD